MARRERKLGKMELEIMQILWRRNGATAREVTEELAARRPSAHSTVQTMLRKLEAKGAVQHEVHDRVFVFRPVFVESEVAADATRDLLSRLFDGSVYGMVAHLLRNERISEDEMEKIRALLDPEDQR